MMSAELLLSIKTLWTVLLATTALITSGSLWGCWQPSRSASEKVMVVSNRGSLDTTCISNVSPDLKLRRWAFLAELDSPSPANPPKITSQRLLMLSRGWLTRWWSRCPVPVFGIHVTVKMSTSDQEFDFFFQLDTVICPMPVISMEVAILGHVSFGWVRLHLRRPS